MRDKHLQSVAIICSIIVIALVLITSVRLAGQNIQTELLPDEGIHTFLFRLELEGQVVAEYTECFGLGSSNEIKEELVETSAGVLVRQKTPGALEWQNILLKRPSLSEPTLWAWRQAMESGDVADAIQGGAIEVLDRDSLEIVARWEFQSGWPASLAFSGTGEELVIVHDGLKRASGEPYEPRR